MPQPTIEEQEEPLDPAMEKIRRKMMLLILVSGGILFLCFMAVLGAIVYKVSQRPAAPAAATPSGGFSIPEGQPLAATAELPAGFAIQSASGAGGQVTFYGTLNGTPKVLLFDIKAGRIIADITVAIPQ